MTERELFDRHNGEWDRKSEADLYDMLDEPEEEYNWKFEEWRYKYEDIA